MTPTKLEKEACADARPRALIVDDQRVIADTLVAILNRKGFAATAAYDGESALETVLRNPPALLVTDVVMPGMNGIQLAIAVRKALPDCPIILFSGNAVTSDLLAEARQDGNDFIVLAKPVHPDELLAQIHQLGVFPPRSE